MFCGTKRALPEAFVIESATKVCLQITPHCFADADNLLSQVAIMIYDLFMTTPVS